MRTIERANKVTINMTEEGFEAKFFRTHKHITTIQSQDTAFTQIEGLNKATQRELFRVWICQNASEYGIEWNPQDMRTEGNKMPNKYTTPELLMSTAVKLVTPDIVEWVSKKADIIELLHITEDGITPVYDHKGKIVEAKYGNGNWAYATVQVTATVREIATGVESYVMMDLSLVSGQLKKPVHIGEGGYNMTSFFTEVSKDIKAIVEKKAEQVEESPAEVVVVEEKSKPAKKSSKKSSAQ